MKCCFCEQPLVCKSCGKPFHARRSETHVGLYQPDVEVSCPECQEVMVCKVCGFRFGAEEDED
jgi:hypothetical protein